jgi:signal transduction histidine kinase
MQPIITKVSGLRLSTKLTLIYSALILVVSGSLALGLYLQSRAAQRQAIRERFLDILSFAGPLVDGDFHSLIRSPGDEKSSFYRVVSLRLNTIRSTSDVIRRIYTLRQQEDGRILYVVDIDSKGDHIGQEYLRESPLLEKGLASITRPVVEDSLYTDASGTFLSGYAPIYDQFGELDGVLGIDIDATAVLTNAKNARRTALIAFLATVPLSLLLGWWLLKRYLAVPVNDLVLGAESVARGQLDTTVPVRSEDELGVLAGVFNQMTAQLRQTLNGLQQEIVEREKAEKELQEQGEHLEELVVERTAALAATNKELESFSYSVSHDLRAPLRHINGYLGLLHERIEPLLDEQSQHYFDATNESAKQMGTLIDDLLLFSRMGRQEMYTRQIDFGSLVQEVIQEYEPETEGRDIHWQISELPVVTGDRAMLRIVMVNLISNALKFTRSRQHAEIEIGCMPETSDEKVFFVRDNGVGFDMQYASKLFGVFQRLHLADEFEGTGIGLANVQRIINRHGGKIWANGEVDHGATFYFTILQPDHHEGGDS